MTKDAVRKLLRPLERTLRLDEESLKKRQSRISDRGLQRYQIVGATAAVLSGLGIRIWAHSDTSPSEPLGTVMAVVGVATFILIVCILFRAGRP